MMRIGILLLNLGGPDSLDAVRPFLYNLFSDREIIRLGPPSMQKPLAWLIATIRSKKTERYYRMIGGKSPILAITQAQAKALEEALNQAIEEKKVIHQIPPYPPFLKGGMGGLPIVNLTIIPAALLKSTSACVTGIRSSMMFCSKCIKTA